VRQILDHPGVRANDGKITDLRGTNADARRSRAGRSLLGIKQTDDRIWLVSFMHYDLGYFDSAPSTAP
jgi:hypothetical protein